MMRLSWVFLAYALYGAGIPDLPLVNTSGFLPVIRAQIEQAAAAARARPRDAQAAGMLAMTLHAYSQYDAAGPVYSRAHLLEPRNFDWVYLLGAVEMAQGQFDSAVESFQIALRIRPDDLVTELRLADCLTALAKWDDAGAHYYRILDRHPDCAQAWYGLGRVQTAKREHTAALQSYGKACEVFPAYGAAHFALAGELRLLGNKAEMGRHLTVYAKNVTVEAPLDDPLFKRIHELNMGVQAHLQRAAELEKAGLLQEAVGENEAALAVDPRDVQVHINLISLFARMADPAKAQQHFEAAIALDPGRSDAWYNDGVLLFKQQNYAGAEEAFRKALDINPDYAEAHNNLGAIYEQEGHLDDAAKEFRQAIADRPDYPLARFHLGRILVNGQRYDEAIQQFLRALSPEDDQTTFYLYALAATYERAGDRAHALAYFQKAHDAAVAHGQSEMLTSIDRDLKALH
ncbi:MAG TPA: tetratricopeptide repeat protein [Candidatus Acidoferrales bacterium]|jgi:tetratricopeptide (TPR) repeat protein|nr:tetratricopeptide repeat protein [Candidatus Acidoferrales bacterium]